MSRRALISGITGQDGAFLARLLLERGYTIYGGMRKSATSTTWRLAALGILDKVKLVDFELLDESNIKQKLREIRPHEFYNLASQSFVSASFQQPLYTTRANAVAVTDLLETIRLEHPDMRFYQASSSEIFGQALESPQKETTSFRPQSPYAIAKAYAHWITANYRSAYGLFACSGILFNHESHLRGLNFVTRKISSTLARIRHDGAGGEVLALGNLDASRDWGYAGEYVEGMWRMLQHARADDFVLATGRSHTVRHFVTAAARALDYEVEWEGVGTEEIGRDRKSGRVLVKVDPGFFRPVDVAALIGDAGKAACELAWRPGVGFEQLVAMMVQADLTRIQNKEPLL